MQVTITLEGPEADRVITALGKAIRSHQLALSKLNGHTRATSRARVQHEADLTHLQAVERRIFDARRANWARAGLR